jgi:poly-gamma-glutamate synthase PgsB/CapB
MVDFILFPSLDPITPALRFLITLTICVLACGFLSCLAFLHSQRLSKIPVRIHVAGTRGKSATVRLIAAGLSAGGYRVAAKVTGTRPIIILPGGTERPVRRWGAAAIREQRDFITVAHRTGSDAIVVEAMGIEPEYLHALERFYIRATDLVITNVRPDHQEQLGSAPGAMADAISEAIPFDGRVFSAVEAAVPIVTERAAAHGCQVSVVASDADDPEDANRQLALEVCMRYGIARADAERAMRSASSNIGAFAITTLHVDGRTISFANAFSCNDVDSLERMWRRHQPAARPAAFVLNPRADRPIRTAEFLKLLMRLAPNAPLFIIGADVGLWRQAIATGFSPERLHRLPRQLADDSLRAIAQEVEDGSIVWGVGNFRFGGARLSALAEAARAPC